MNKIVSLALLAGGVVLHDGVIVERGNTSDVLRAPTDPYTRELLAAVPRLQPPSQPPSQPQLIGGVS